MGFGMGMGMASGMPRGYATPFDDWHLYKQPRGQEVPAGARARIDVTDPNGHRLHSEYVNGDARERARVYDWARRTYGPGNYAIFFNKLGSD